MHKTALLLSGQGAQKAGMASDFARDPRFDDIFEAAGDICGFDVRAACGDAEALRDAYRVQPALCAASIASARALALEGLEPSCVAGFSLGQVAALHAAGMLSLVDTFRLVDVRARAMARAALARPGAMCALSGGDEGDVVALCERCANGDVLVPANFNAPGQVVVSGDAQAVRRAADAWKAPGLRATMLPVAGAFHSPLMDEAAAEVAAFLEGIAFAPARIALVNNVDALPLEAARAREQVAAQVRMPVRFAHSVSWMRAQGVRFFVECGSGAVLSGLVRRIDASAVRYRASTWEEAVSAARACAPCATEGDIR